MYGIKDLSALPSTTVSNHFVDRFSSL